MQRRSVFATGWMIWALGVGCASAAPPGGSVAPVADNTPPPRRHRRRHRPVDPSGSPAPGDTTGGTPTVSIGALATAEPQHATDGVATDPPPSNTAAFGTPTVAGRREDLTAQWLEDQGRNRIVCGGSETHAAPHCPQCPDEPSNAALVRAFLPSERATLDCNPPSNHEGRLPIRATFNAAGYPTEFRFPGMTIERDMGICIGRALCRVRVPTFRSPEATMDYDYVVMLPDTPR